jgi:hypothetical protein
MKFIEKIYLYVVKRHKEGEGNLSSDGKVILVTSVAILTILGARIIAVWMAQNKHGRNMGP